MIAPGKEAKLYLSDGHYDIMQPGDHVKCSVTGQKIFLQNLRYWSVDLQEVYVSGEVSVSRVVAMKSKIENNASEDDED